MKDFSGAVIMTDEQIWASVTSVFQSVFDRDSIEVGPATTANDIEEWDSLNHVQLIVAIEAEFKIRFRPVEVAAFENVGDMVQALKKHKNL